MRSWTERRLERRAAGVILVVIVVLTGTIGGCGLVDRLLGGQQGEPYTVDPSDFEGDEPAFVDLHGIDRLVLKVEAPDEDGRSYIAELRARESSTDYYGWASFLGPFRNNIPYLIDLFAMEEKTTPATVHDRCCWNAGLEEFPAFQLPTPFCSIE